MRTGAAVTKTHDEDALWQQHLEVLRTAIEQQQADAIDRVKLEIRKLDGEIAAVANRREILARSNAKGGIYSSIEVVIDANLARLNKRMGDLRDLLKNVRKVMLPDKAGPTPEAAVKPILNSLLDLPEGLRAAAVELRCGWIVRSPAAQKVKAAQMERIGGPSVGEYGETAGTLEQRYLGWAREMGRQRIPAWPIEDVVILDRGYLESATLRRSDGSVVRGLVEIGLRVYCIEYPDRLPQPE